MDRRPCGSGAGSRPPSPASSRQSRRRPACSRCRPTPELVRVAGRLDLADGSVLTWSAADGARGRRWRAVSSGPRGISHVLLLEVDPAGRPSRLELTTPAGLLTLHPSPDQREIHGNVVGATGEGVRPLAFAWSPDHELEVVGRPIATSVALHRREATTRVGARGELDVLLIEPDLVVAPARRGFARLAESRWRVGTAELEIDADGLPVGGSRWSLETD